MQESSCEKVVYEHSQGLEGNWGGGGVERKPEFSFTESGIVSDSFSDFWQCGNKYAVNTHLYECITGIIIRLAFREGS